MSRFRQRVEALRQVVQIRSISAKLAEAKSVMAARDLAVSKDRQKTQQELLQKSVEGWEAALAASSFDPNDQVIWGCAINGGVSNVAAASANTAICEQSLNSAQAYLADCMANESCAMILLAKANRIYSRELENKGLDEQADQVTRMELRR